MPSHDDEQLMMLDPPEQETFWMRENVDIFSQEYAVEAYARDRERAGYQRGYLRSRIHGSVEICQALGTSMEEAIHVLASLYSISEEEAAKYAMEFWQS